MTDDAVEIQHHGPTRHIGEPTLHRVAPDVSAWDGVIVGEPIAGGHRNKVWHGAAPDGPVAVRRSRRSPESLRWELDLLRTLAGDGFWVPLPLETADGRLSCEGVVVQRWMPGRPPHSTGDWLLVADELRRLHARTVDHPQRPDACAVAELHEIRRSIDADLDALPTDVAIDVCAVFSEYEDESTSVIHGDPGASNLRIRDGKVGLLDWDESRVDVPTHDLSNLGVQVLDDEEHAAAQVLSDAWEAVNAWTSEPAYARQRLEGLRHRRRGT